MPALLHRSGHRPLAWLLLSFGFIVAAGPAAAQDAMLAKALAFKPRQSGVPYQQIPADQIDQCRGEETTRDGVSGYLVTSPTGQTLRWLADTDNNRKVDTWCFYSDGVEIYREWDSNGDGQPDQFRWLGSAGLRWGIDTSADGKIDVWKMISAEEATAEVVEAIRTGDISRFERLLLSSDELDALGVGPETAKQLQERLATVTEAFKTFASEQKLITNSSRWAHFGAQRPGAVPSGTLGSTRDLVAYENAVAIIDTDGQDSQLLIGTLIQVDQAWRVIDPPTAISAGTVLDDRGLFFAASAPPPQAPNRTAETGELSADMQVLITELERIDNALTQSPSTQQIERLQGERADQLRKLALASPEASERDMWIRQLADTVSAATQSNELSDGPARLEQLEADVRKLAAPAEVEGYVVFRRLQLDYNRKISQPDADFQQVQDQYTEQLQRFIQRYPEAEDTPEAIIQVALSSEFSGSPQKAIEWYSQAAERFPDTLAGRRARGSINRLQLEGRALPIKATTLDGRPFDSNQLVQAKRFVVYHYWATWCEPCKEEMVLLRQLQARYAQQGLSVIGINVDSDPDLARQFLKQAGNAYPWPHLYSEGGLDSSLAVGLGVLTLPLAILVDNSGKVVRMGSVRGDLEGTLQEQFSSTAPGSTASQPAAKPAANPNRGPNRQR
jgi:thiol-disulfide isomerase/thioredoxin